MNWLQLDLPHLLALAAAIGFASGVRVYALVFVIGLAGYSGWLHLPVGMQILAHPAVMIAAGTLTVIEFLADKVPAIDTVWDGVHTFIRLPAAIALTASLGSSKDGLAAGLALLGGVFAATGHFAKAGTRAALNTSPEPFSNWAASFSEDIFSLGLLWLIIHYPLGAGMLALLMSVLSVWLISHLWRFVARLFRRSTLQPLPGIRRHVTS